MRACAGVDQLGPRLQASIDEGCSLGGPSGQLQPCAPRAISRALPSTDGGPTQCSPAALTTVTLSVNGTFTSRASVNTKIIL